MPYRSQATLQTWVAEFQALGYALEDALRVIEQDGDAGDNTGLVALTLADATTSVFIQPCDVGSTKWCVTFEARDEPVELSAAQVAGLSAELAIVSALCAFLEAKASVIGEDD